MVSFNRLIILPNIEVVLQYSDTTITNTEIHTDVIGSLVLDDRQDYCFSKTLKMYSITKFSSSVPTRMTIHFRNFMGIIQYEICIH